MIEMDCGSDCYLDKKQETQCPPPLPKKKEKRLKNCRKLRDAIIDYFCIRYKSILVSNTGGDIVLRTSLDKNNYPSSFFIIQIDTKGWWIFEKIKEIIVYKEKPTINTPKHLRLELGNRISSTTDVDIRFLDELDFLIYRTVFAFWSGIKKPVFKEKNVEKFMKTRGLVK